jgi:hypothetical protein
MIHRPFSKVFIHFGGHRHPRERKKKRKEACYSIADVGAEMVLKLINERT